MAILILLMNPVATMAQGFAGMGATAGGFAEPDPATRLRFPADHAAHPGFRIEWWYLTANLTGPDGTPMGVQWTLFRTALDPANPDAQVWMGNAALTTATRHLTAERLARGGTGQAGVELPLVARIDEWVLSGDPAGRMQVTAGGNSFAYQLDLTAETPLILHGENGYSVKSAKGQASHYYSAPRLAARGWVETDQGRIAVTGQAWLDREWSSQPLSADQTGWDWFSLSFDDASQLMAFRLRGASDFTAATWIDPDGTATALGNGAVTVTPLTGDRPPTEWRLTLPARDVDVTVTALNPDAAMPMLFPYWEGPVIVSGNRPGRGYLEMTGYD